MNLSKYTKILNNEKLIKIIGFCLIVLFYAILGIFKFSQKDEVLYMRESLLMAELLKNGEWFGNYAVGTHGFLFKLPIAIAYIIIGPNSYITSLYNGVLAGLTFLIFYKIARKHFNLNTYYSSLALTLVLLNAQILISTFLFLREPAVLLIVGYFIDSVFEKRGKIYQGLILLIMFDAKEHVFFTISTFYMIGLAIESYFVNGLRKIKCIFEDLSKYAFKLFVPTAIIVIFMHTTQFIPINMYASYVIGTIDGGANSQLKQIRTGSNNNVKLENIYSVRSNYEDSAIYKSTEKIILAFKKSVFVKYIFKIFYPRTFGFLSLQLIFIIPAIYEAIRCASRHAKVGRYEHSTLLSILLGYLLIYIIYYSHGRYLVPVIPFLSFYFIKYLINVKKSNEFVLYIALLIFLVSLFYEVSYHEEKLILGLIICCAMMAFLLLNHRGLKNVGFFLVVLVVTLINMTTGMSYLYSESLGQIKNNIMWGRDGEFGIISKLVPINEKVMINDNERLLAFYRGDHSTETEVLWTLNDNIPKKDMLIQYNSALTSGYSGNYCLEVLDHARNEGTKYILLLESLRKTKFPYQQCVNEFTTRCGEFKKEELKGKRIYIVKTSSCN